MRGAILGKLATAGAAALAVGALVRRPYSFVGRVALITGGTRGLGLVLARQLLRRGASVAICGRDEITLRRAQQALRAFSPARVLAERCDVGDREQVEALVGRVIAHFGRIDLLANVAGVIQVGPIEEMTAADFEASMRTHFYGPLYAILAALPSMRERGSGRILNVSSFGGRISVPHLVPYCAGKFALAGLSEGLHAELARSGIAVTTAFPGLMRTGSPRNAQFKGQHRAEHAWFKLSDSIPGISMGAERAARQILRAVRRGDAEVVLSVPAKLAVRFHGAFPAATQRLLSWVNAALPRPGGIGQRLASGWESESKASESFLTGLSARAAERNNET